MLNTPATTRAAVIHQYAAGVSHISLEERPVTPPGRGEVLIRIAAAPINPSDLAFLAGNYGVRKPLPCVPGFEGGGVVIAVGEGVDPALIGRTAACFAADSDGTWMEVMRTRAAFCFPANAGIDPETAATLLVNPLTALALLDRAVDSQGATPAIAQTAAASALGQMIARLALERGIAAVHIVRRESQVETLRALGAEHVLNSEAETFDHDFRDLSRKLGVRVCFDAVAGDLGARLLRLMPAGSRLIIYGGLGGESVSAAVGDLIFRNKAVEGFWLSSWLRDTAAAARAWSAVQAAAGTTFVTEVRARTALARIGEALADYAQQMSGGKVLIVP
ncbi:MAG: zinc-binding dehydrogenase [Anaerolineae bacterium]|nr:zinc-binding dehydrogenase [Anaerolineae bacterium]